MNETIQPETLKYLLYDSLQKMVANHWSEG